jgi:DnaK suppressor protein
MAARLRFSTAQSLSRLVRYVHVTCLRDSVRRFGMTKKDIQNIKRRLLVERERVEESLYRNTQHVLGEIDNSTRDAGDLAAASHDRGVLYRLQDCESKRLTLINAVLSRIDQDEYGICEQCGREIGKTRLEAIPWATSCSTCQERTDLRECLSNRSFQDLKGNREYGAA